MVGQLKVLDPAAFDAPPENPGALLRALRRKRGWTLSDVSRQTGVQVSTLSKLENGKLSFTYDKLIQISNGLEIDMGELLSPTSPSLPVRLAGRRSVTRKNEGVPVTADTYTYRHIAADLLNKQFMPMVGDVRARSLEEYGEMLSHPGEELIYVLEGTCELHTALYAPVRLEEGDSVYFDSDMKHAYIAIGPKKCRILSVCTGAPPPAGEEGASNGTDGSGA